LVQLTSFLILFLLGTMVGWVIDSGYRSLVDRRWTNAGYFIGPFCPIYGFGGIMLLFLVSFFSGYPFLIRCVIYFLAMMMVELVGGLFSTYILKVRLWDYSDAPFNLFGQVDLLHSFYWLILALLFQGIVWPIFTFVNEFASLVLWVDLAVASVFFMSFSLALGRKMIKERRSVKPFIKEGTPDAVWKQLEKINDQYITIMETLDEKILIPSEKRSKDILDEHEYLLADVYGKIIELQNDVNKLKGRIPITRSVKDLARYNKKLSKRKMRLKELRIIENNIARTNEIRSFVESQWKTNSSFINKFKRTSEIISWRSYVRRRGRSFHPFAFLDRFPQWQAGWRKRKQDIFTLIRSDKG